MSFKERFRGIERWISRVSLLYWIRALWQELRESLQAKIVTGVSFSTTTLIGIAMDTPGYLLGLYILGGVVLGLFAVLLLMNRRQGNIKERAEQRVNTDPEMDGDTRAVILAVLREQGGPYYGKDLVYRLTGYLDPKRKMLDGTYVDVVAELERMRRDGIVVFEFPGETSEYEVKDTFQWYGRVELAK